MTRASFPLLAMLLLAACGEARDDNADAAPPPAATVSDQTPPGTRHAAPPAMAIAPVRPPVAASDPSPPAASAGAIPAAYQGRWTGEGDSCGDRAAALELTVTPDRLIFHESVGTVDAVRPDGDGRLAVDAAFTGEGQSWRRSLTLARTGDRLTVHNDGTGATRKRC
jgi:hypothetical protein